MRKLKISTVKDQTGKLTTKRPWNRINSPVYSISSTDGKDQANMHIITYVTAISMHPKRFVCGIYHGTKTFENIEQHPGFILQLLADNQYRLVDLLGKKTGHTTDKIARLTKKEALEEWKGFPILKNCLAVMEMKVRDRMDAGDHTILLCDVLSYKNMNNGTPLTLDILRANKLIRI